MEPASMIRARIAGTGSALPNRVLTNKEFESMVETDDDWIVRRTGIRERRISTDRHNESTAGIATEAAMKALNMSGISPQELDMIIVGTITPDFPCPSVACLVQGSLGAPSAVAFDVSAGCSSFIYALSMADNAIATGRSKNVLVIGSERLSSITNWEDRSTCVLLGDGAGAIVLTPSSDHHGILSTHLGNDGDAWELLYCGEREVKAPRVPDGVQGSLFYLKMDGNRLFKKAVTCMADIAQVAMSQNNLSSNDIRLVVPHQANMRIIQAAAKRLSIPMEKIYSNLHKYGNTSSASIPIALDEACREGLLKEGDHILMVTFGAGLTWGAAIVKWSLVDPIAQPNPSGVPLKNSSTPILQAA